MELGSVADPVWGQRLAQTPFAAAVAAGAPLFVACDEPPRLVFATSSALEAFGVADTEALDGVALAADTPGARRLRSLATTLPLGAAPRLQRLRYFAHRKPLGLSLLCARLQLDGETYFVAADPSPRAQETTPERVSPSVDVEPPAEPQRFVWRLDGEDRFADADPALREAFGESAPREGETLSSFADRLALGPAWGEAVAARTTFSKLRVNWPEPDWERARVTRVSGAPVFAAGAAYRGFRGFGVVSGERVAAPTPPSPVIVVQETPATAPPIPMFKPIPGDAAALISLLQRQHPSGAAPPATPGVSAPALAVISALATLLAPKPAPLKAAAAAEAKAAPPRPSPVKPQPTRPAAEPAATGAEIVVLRPHAPANDLGPRESDTIALTSQERDAFKEIARALGANVRNAPPGAEFFAETEAARLDEPTPAPEETAAEPVPVVEPAHDDLAALLDILPIAAIVARDGEALYVNKTLLDLAGYRSLEDFRARDGLKAIFRGRDPSALAPGGTLAATPLVAANDRILTVDALVRPAKWGGEPAELIAMRRSREADHQAQLRAVEQETAMHAARARDLAAALEAARDGMARIDRTGCILGLNAGAERLFGYAQNEAAGDSVLRLFAPSSQSMILAALQRLVRAEAGPVETLSAIARHQDGRHFTVQIDVGRLANEPDPDYFVLVSKVGAQAAAPPAPLQTPTPAQNPTPAQDAPLALDEAERASEAKTELLSRVSHEMRTPLHAILGFAEVMMEERFGAIGNERYRDYVRDIHASSRHVLSLANDLLDLTKIELGKVELQFSALDLNRIVRESVSLMQPQAARERVIMRLSLYDRLPNVTADERSLRQILLNLMANAVKYNEPGGQVIVSTAIDDGGAVILRVRDTGVGMNESELAIALQPFRRVPGFKAVEGSGLGLPLTKALAEANHADFSIRSRKDQGTLVEIAFPVQRAAQ